MHSRFFLHKKNEKRLVEYLDRKEIVSIFAPAFEDEGFNPEFERRDKKIFENIPYTFFLRQSSIQGLYRKIQERLVPVQLETKERRNIKKEVVTRRSRI